jgi:putative phosphoribosyl transferase
MTSFMRRAARAGLGMAGLAVVLRPGSRSRSAVRSCGDRLAREQVARAQGASRVVLAVPVAPPTSISELRQDADEVVCLERPGDFFAIGQFYADFSQTSDDEVSACLERAAARPHPTAAASTEDPPDPPARDEEVAIEAGPLRLSGHLTVPDGAPGIVIFAHGSGSSRHSPRNRFVATVLNRAGLGTLLFDLLTPVEEIDRANVFDIELLAERLVDVTDWLRREPDGADTRIGYLGASTGAAAALWAAADLDADIAAVVSRGGRPDLAAPRLSAVRAPTLLIVGGEDQLVLALNRRAQAELHCENRLAVVRGATHLFGEPGALMAAAGLARDWFVEHLATVAMPAGPAPGIRR